MHSSLRIIYIVVTAETVFCDQHKTENRNIGIEKKLTKYQQLNKGDSNLS